MGDPGINIADYCIDLLAIENRKSGVSFTNLLSSDFLCPSGESPTANRASGLDSNQDPSTVLALWDLILTLLFLFLHR